MDRLQSVSSYIAAASLDADLKATMENYLVDLRDFTTAMEVSDGGASFVKKAVDAIGNFMRKAKQRLMELVDNLIRRLGEMIGAANNMMHTKDIKVPDEMAKSYKDMSALVVEMTESSDKYVADINGYYGKLEAYISTQGITGRDPARRFIDECKKENDIFKEKIAALKERDVLKGQSVDAYIAEHVEENGRNTIINPSTEQRQLTGMRSKWQRIRARLKSTASSYGQRFALSEAMAPSPEIRQGLQTIHSLLSEAYNAAMIKVTGALSVISYLQKYISGFILIDKKYPPMKGIIREPAAGALPAHS